MTRDEIERLLHCARHEAQGAGPNTLAEVCEWALERAVTCDRIANEMRKRAEAAEKAEAELNEAWLAVDEAEARVSELEARNKLLEGVCNMFEENSRVTTERWEEWRAGIARVRGLEAKLAMVRGALFVVRDAMASNDESPDATAEENWWDPRRPIATKVWQACAALSDKEPKPNPAPSAEPPCGGSRCYQGPGGEWIHSSKSYGSCAVRREGWVSPDEAERPREARDEALEEAAKTIERMVSNPYVNRRMAEEVRALKSKKETP